MPTEAPHRQLEGDPLKRLLKVASERLLMEQLLMEQLLMERAKAGQIRKVDPAPKRTDGFKQRL